MKRLIMSMAMSSLLAGCATPLSLLVDKKVDKASARATELAQQQKTGRTRVASESRTAIERVDGIWLPFKRLSEINEQASAKEAATRRITVNRDFRNIQEVAERVTLLTGIPVKVAPDAMVPFAGTAPATQQAALTATAAPGAPGAGNLPIPALPPITGSPAATYAVQPAPAVQSGAVALSFDGTLAGFLDVAAARFGVSWEWTDSAINVYRYTTRSYRLVALPGDSNMQNTITSQTGGTGGGGGGGGGSGSSSGGTVGGSSSSGISIANLSVWSAISEAIKGMLTPRGTVAVNAATGTVLVTDTPQVLARVGLFIEQQNASLSKQVMVNVRVLSVDISDDAQYGINWQLLNRSLALSSPFAAAASATSLTVGVFGDSGVTPGNIASRRGLTAVISALSEQGRVSQVTSTSLMTLNNQPAPLQVGRQTAYLASLATTLSAGIGATTTLTPGLVTTGFSMSLVPHILDKGKLMLQFAINISSLLKLNTSKSSEGGSQIQTPEVDTRNFLQRVMLNSGDTLILTGFEQENVSNNSSGVGNARNFLFGGGITSEDTRSTLVILIQPVVGEPV